MSTIAGKIDVTKIDKARLYKGKKGTYLDVVLLASPDNEYGNDFMIVQSVSKEDRAAGKKGPILGNAKFLQRTSGGNRDEGPREAFNRNEAVDEDVPF